MERTPPRSGFSSATSKHFAHPASLIDDFTVHGAPALLGAGKRLFEQLGATTLAAEATAASHLPLVSHAS